MAWKHHLSGIVVHKQTPHNCFWIW